MGDSQPLNNGSQDELADAGCFKNTGWFKTKEGILKLVEVVRFLFSCKIFIFPCQIFISLARFLFLLQDFHFPCKIFISLQDFYFHYKIIILGFSLPLFAI